MIKESYKASASSGVRAKSVPPVQKRVPWNLPFSLLTLVSKNILPLTKFNETLFPQYRKGKEEEVMKLRWSLWEAVTERC